MTKQNTEKRLLSLMLAMLMVTSLFSVTGVTVNAEVTSQMVFTYEDKTFTVDIGGTLSPENMAYVLKNHSRVNIVEAYSSNSEYFEVKELLNQQEIVAKKPFTGTEQLTLDLFSGSETYVLTVTCTEQPVEHPAVTPKCEESGNIRYWTLGGYYYSDEACKSEITEADTVLAATDHDWNAPTYEWSADRSTCTAVRTCKNDITHIETETSDVASRKVKDPTCEEKGETLYTAEFTNTIFEKQELTEANIAALEHDWNTPTYGWSSDGSVCIATRACKRDTSHIETEIVNTTSEKTKDPTCGEKGETTYTAEFTNAAFTKQEMVKADIDESEHVWNAPTYIWSDDMSVCVATRTCKNNASHVETEIAGSSRSTKAPNCEEQGINTYTAEFTNPSFEIQTKTVTNMDALGHRFINFVKWVWDSFNNAIAWLSCDNDPDHVQTIDVSSTIDTVDTPDCTHEGYRYHVATIDVAGKTYTTVNVETLDQLGHDWMQRGWYWNFFDDDGNRIDMPEAAALFLCEHDSDHEMLVPAVVIKTEDDKGITYTATAEYDGRTYMAEAFFPKATPDVPTPDVPTPDISTPDVPTPDEPTPDEPRPVVPTPDKPIPAVPTPDEPTPVVPTPDEPTPVVPTPDEPEPIKEISGILGDVNNDGSVDSADALMILRNSVGLEEFDDTQRFLGDVNEDDENIDSSDALAVLRYSIGIIDMEKIGTHVSKTVA